MFKKLDKAAAAAAIDALAQTEAEKVIARGERIKLLSDDASMWRSFSTGCVKGRQIYENYNMMCSASPPRLFTRMDADTALLWKEFAVRMADDRERRLRDALGI